MSNFVRDSPAIRCSANREDAGHHRTHAYIHIHASRRRTCRGSSCETIYIYTPFAAMSKRSLPRVATLSLSHWLYTRRGDDVANLIICILADYTRDRSQRGRRPSGLTHTHTLCVYILYIYTLVRCRSVKR